MIYKEAKNWLIIIYVEVLFKYNNIQHNVDRRLILMKNNLVKKELINNLRDKNNLLVLFMKLFIVV